LVRTRSVLPSGGGASNVQNGGDFERFSPPAIAVDGAVTIVASAMLAKKMRVFFMVILPCD
jgi:hypothetical protein